jgi:hypothetical protein
MSTEEKLALEGSERQRRVYDFGFKTLSPIPLSSRFRANYGLAIIFAFDLLDVLIGGRPSCLGTGGIQDGVCACAINRDDLCGRSLGTFAALSDFAFRGVLLASSEVHANLWCRVWLAGVAGRISCFCALRVRAAPMRLPAPQHDPQAIALAGHLGSFHLLARSRERLLGTAAMPLFNKASLQFYYRFSQRLAE